MPSVHSIFVLRAPTVTRQCIWLIALMTDVMMWCCERCWTRDLGPLGVPQIKKSNYRRSHALTRWTNFVRNRAANHIIFGVLGPQ